MKDYCSHLQFMYNEEYCTLEDNMTTNRTNGFKIKTQISLIIIVINITAV